jgi:hypothetical protein
MEVWLNGRLLDGETAGGTLQEILENMVAQTMGDDATMSEVRINGVPYSLKDMGPADRMGRVGIARLEVETVSSRQVALHFLANSEAFLGPIMEAVLQVAELFRVSDEREANQQYLRLLESVQLFLQTLDMARQTLSLDFGRVSWGGMSAEQRLKKLSSLVQELLGAQESQDWILLADVLQYDLIEELKGWLEHLPALRAQALS